MTAADEQLTPPEPEVIEPGTDVAVVDPMMPETLDVSQLEPDWPYAWMDFEGDKLAVRLPSRTALSAFFIMSSQYVDMTVKSELTGAFIRNHLSPQSFRRVFLRLMNEDEKRYSEDTIGELFNAMAMASIEADKAAEQAAQTNGQEPK